MLDPPWQWILNPILHRGVNEPSPAVFWLWPFERWVKWADFSWLCSFQQSTGPSKAIFFFQIFEKFCLEDTWSPKILTRNSQKSKKNPFFPDKYYFFFLNLNSTSSQLSFEVQNVSVAQNLKIQNFGGQKLAGNSKIQILSYMYVIYLKRKLRSCRIYIQHEKVWFVA